MASLKPLIFFAHKSGPNPWKVGIFLEELGIPYTIEFKEFGDGPNGVKNASYTKVNPNGRVPALIDPNNGDLVIWESGAILLYLEKQYDKDHKFGAKTPQEDADLLSWLFLQVSGFGPSQGQVNWFLHYQPGEKIQAAIDRYTNETKRLYNILNTQLAGREFIVTDHFTYVDAAFYPWIRIAGYANIDIETTVKNDYPNIYAWYKRVAERPAVIKVYEHTK